MNKIKKLSLVGTIVALFLVLGITSVGAYNYDYRGNNMSGAYNYDYRGNNMSGTYNNDYRGNNMSGTYNNDYRGNNMTRYGHGCDMGMRGW